MKNRLRKGGYHTCSRFHIWVYNDNNLGVVAVVRLKRTFRILFQDPEFSMEWSIISHSVFNLSHWHKNLHNVGKKTLLHQAEYNIQHQRRIQYFGHTASYINQRPILFHPHHKAPLRGDDLRRSKIPFIDSFSDGLRKDNRQGWAGAGRWGTNVVSRNAGWLQWRGCSNE